MEDLPSSLGDLGVLELHDLLGLGLLEAKLGESVLNGGDGRRRVGGGLWSLNGVVPATRVLG